MKCIYKLLVIMISISMLSGCVKYVNMADLQLVTKNYPKPDEVSNLSFALAEPDLKIKYSLTGTNMSGLSERIRYDANKVACFMTAESEKILSYNSMTFTQKRNTSALFYPEIVIDIEEKAQREHITAPFYFPKDKLKGRLEINAKVNIIMLEPLSGEKLWVKSIPDTGINEV